MPDTATLSDNFQITIPEDVRASQHWEAGQIFAFIPKAGGYLLVPVPDEETMRGIAKGPPIENYRDRKDRY